MRVLSVELDDDTVAALEAERELLGFESRGAYVRWIVENRGSIEATPTGGSPDDSEPDRDADADDGWRPVVSDPSIDVRGTPRTTVKPGSPASSGDEDPDTGSSGERDDGSTAVDRAARSRTAKSQQDRAATADASDRSRNPRSDASERRRTDRTRTAEATANPDAATDASDGRERPRTDPQAAATREADPDEDVDAANLAPERVERISEDPVAEDAGVLGSVETERLDELTRRAVAKTRKRLNRDVQTGLEYASSTSLAGSDLRPGEDVVDLESLDVPGYGEDVERRREAAGRAIAYLRDEGRARKSDFVDALYEDCPAGYDTPDGWWRCVKRALKQVDAVDGGDGARVWRFDG